MIFSVSVVVVALVKTSIMLEGRTVSGYSILPPRHGPRIGNIPRAPSVSRSKFLLLCGSKNNPMESADNVEEDDDNLESSFYRDLEKAKQSKFGADLPKEQLEESAQEARDEFLKAMKEASFEFKTVKEALGSQGAIDLFLGKIQEEDERQARQVDENDDEDDENHDNNDGDDDDDDDESFFSTDGAFE